MELLVIYVAASREFRSIFGQESRVTLRRFRATIVAVEKQ